MKIHTLTIVGVGLIGGSIGLAAKKRGLAERVRGVGRNQANLERARALSIVDEISLDLKAAAADTELIVMCTPVDRIAGQVLEMAPRCKPGTLITDAGSTKQTIVEAIEPWMPEGVHFVGSHPLAGSEKKGPEYAQAELFQNRWTIVTPTPTTHPDALQQTQSFWQELGCKVRLLTPGDHDHALAMTSHLPHLLASAMAGILPDEFRDLTATGFRDTTRIAAGDPELWTAIFTHNRQAVGDALASLMDRLRQFDVAMATQDTETLTTLLTQAKKVRDALGS